MPETNLKWVLAVSLVMFLGSGFIASYYGFLGSSSTRDAWYYLRITLPLFQVLTIGSSALCIAGFAKKWTYTGSVFFFAVSVLLLFILGFRGFF